MFFSNWFATDKERRLMECIAKGKEKNLSVISEETNIPLSTCSRVLNQLTEKNLIVLVNTTKTDEKAVLFTPRGFDFAVVHYEINAQSYINANPRLSSRLVSEVLDLVSEPATKSRMWYAICKYRLDNNIYGRQLSTSDFNNIASIAAIDLSVKLDDTTAKRIGSTHTREVAKYLNEQQRAINNVRRSLGIS